MKLARHTAAGLCGLHVKELRMAPTSNCMQSVQRARPSPFALQRLQRKSEPGGPGRAQASDGVW